MTYGMRRTKPRMKVHDVVIVGAGPGGLNTAKELAEKGLDVVVLEKKNEIGTNIVCTGILGKEAFEKFGLPRDSVVSKIQNVTMISPFGTSIAYEHPESFAYVVNRQRFDQNLADIAVSKGADLRLQNQVFDVHIDQDHVDIFVRRKNKSQVKYRAKVLVVATGIDGTLSKKLGLGFPKNFVNGAQVEFETQEAEGAKIIVGQKTTPGGFGWMIPVQGNRARIGLITDKEPKTYIWRLVQTLYPEKKLTFKDDNFKCKAIAQGLVKRTYGRRILSVGEAAGQVKTTTGGGIYYGLLCSRIASQVIANKLNQDDFSDEGFSDYERLWRKAIQREITIGYLTRKLCGQLSDHQIERVFQIAKSDGIIPLIKGEGNFDWHGDLILSIAKRVPLKAFLNLQSPETLKGIIH